MCVHTHVDARSQNPVVPQEPLTLVFETETLPRTYDSLSSRDRLACLCFPNTEVKNLCYSNRLCMWDLGIELRSSHFTR